MGYYLVDGELWDEETGEYAGPMSSWITGNETGRPRASGDAEAHGH